MEDWGYRFEKLRERYRRDDGSKWSGAAIERATSGKVTGHYVSELRRGEIQEPGISKIRAISEVMGIPIEEWFREEEEEDE